MTNRFSIPLADLAEKMKGDVELVVRKITFQAFSRVVEKSPVDTGRFRANWNVSLGAPDYTFTTSTNQARGMEEAQKALTLPVGGVTAISNGLPYAGELERGSSKQAPMGMIRLTALEISQKLGGKS